jgi:hypothetical protein
MAISILNDFGINVVFRPTNISTTSISLVAGSNRIFAALVTGVDINTSGSAPPEALPNVTYGGVPMGFLQGIDGTQSFLSNALASPPTRAYGLLYALRESQLPPNGANNLIVDWPGLSGSLNWGFRGTTWTLGNCDQRSPVRDVQVRERTIASPNDLVTRPGGTSDALILGATHATSSGVGDFTINGGGVTEDVNIGIGGVGRCVGFAQAAAGSLAGITAAFTYSVVSQNVLVVARLAEFFPPIGGRCRVQVGL